MKPIALHRLLRRAAVPLMLGLSMPVAAEIQVPGPLVETGWLADHLGEVVILDIRADGAGYLGQPPAPDQELDLKKLAGHVPGAVLVPWKGVVAKGGERGVPLKTMLPSPDAFASLMRASGVGNDSALVIVGRGTTAKDQAYAARLYFTLKYFGHDNVALLNGGTAQWAVEGRPLAYAEEVPQPGDFAVAETRPHLVADTGDVEAAVASGDAQLVDCRTEDFYLGLNFKRKFVSPAHKGHLAGAKTLPFVLLGDNSGPARLFSADQMRQVAALKGVALEDPTIAYCNTGVAASLGWFALHELLGNGQARLYDGSMHAWSSLDPSHEVVSLERTETPIAAVEAGPPAGADAAPAAIAGPPRSLQTLVDERRDQLRRRRDDYFDAMSGRRLFQPGWMAAREAMSDAYRDSMRTAHRQQRDAMRLHQDAMRNIYAPWSRTYRDAAEIRHFVSQMEQLDRQELYDGARFTGAYAPW